MRMQINATLDFVSRPDAKNGLPLGNYIVKVQVLDSDENNNVPMKDIEVTMTVGDQTQTKRMDTVTELRGTDYYSKFQFTPSDVGVATLHFAAGELALDFDVDVQEPQEVDTD